eukprot:TRINITY_DN2776_c0_g1_i1.p1 TRINITY_DN2776_c0_g1~~TRINITY_DN2776_c0_g1_i1.p1  ORF type:complete len:894 (+),score=204.72 TRINITY_DN2776_c0_g1_i1:62-2743(+)
MLRSASLLIVVVFVAVQCTATEKELLRYDVVQCPASKKAECLCSQLRAPETCPAGYYCMHNANNTLVQHKCSEGMFCPENTYQPIYCCDGHFCETTSKIEVCPAGYFCRRGQIDPKKCSPMTDCPEGTSKPRRVGSLVIFIFFGIFFFVVYALIEYSVQKHRKRKTKHRQQAQAQASGEMKNLGIQMEEKTEKYTISFDELGLTLPNGTKIMDGVNGEVKAGRLTAIMGPSGAGKTTFLSLLSGKVKKTKGTIKINGNVEEEGVTRLKKLVGFVPQEDVMLRMMTVKENLVFSARYRLPSNWTNEQISQRVSEVIDVLGLSHVIYSPIGDERQRGISGGQRKRVNIGMELVADPSILFLDEPTSGLDSTSSEEVLGCLQKIASLGITIATVIHQPRYEIFLMFDDVLLLGKGGRTVYIGPSNEALAYFTGLGFYLPAHGNPADFFMDVIAGKVPRFTKKPLSSTILQSLGHEDLSRVLTINSIDSSARQIVLSQKITGTKLAQLGPNGVAEIFGSAAPAIQALLENPGAYSAVEEDAEFTKEKLFTYWEQKTGTQSSSQQLATTQVAEENIFAEAIEDLKEWANDFRDSIVGLVRPDPFRQTPGFFMQLWYCFARAFVQTYRDRNKVILDNLLHLFAGLFLGVASRDLVYIGPLPEPVAATCPFELYSMGTCDLPVRDTFVSSGNLIAWGIGFAGIASAVGTFGNEKVVYWRESASGLNPLSYFLSKVLADIPRIVLASTLFFLAYIFVFTPVGSLGDLYVIMLMLYWAGFSSGYFISQLVRVEVAPLVGVAFALVWAIVFSGSNPRLPEVDNDFGSGAMFFWDISYARWAVEAFYLMNVKPFDYVDIDPGLEYWGYELSHFAECLGRIFGIGVLWQALAYIAMVVRDQDKKK